MYIKELRLHFVGIGGVGMAPIAEILLSMGYEVSGSDLRENSLVSHLHGLGARISLGHSRANLSENTDVLVCSSAISEDNPEVLEAKRRKIPVIPRAEMLAELMRMKYGVAIAGSHGKTTTTAMTAVVLSHMGLDPSVVIGGRERNKVSGARVGTGDYLVAEADESDGSFRLLRPVVAVITNVDREHLGHYGSFGALERAFSDFMSSIPFYGLVAACGDDPVLQKLLVGLKRRVVTFGLSEENEIRAADIEVDASSSRFELQVRGRSYGKASIPLPGFHMVSNALGAIAVGLELGGEPRQCIEALGSFDGVARRSELLGIANGVAVIDDYAHHPTEIAATLAAIRCSYARHMHGLSERSDGGRIWALFQPHRYSRTRDLFGSFISCFGDCDHLVIGDVYSAGEDAMEGVSGRSLAAAVEHNSVRYCGDVEDCFSELLGELEPGDVVVTLGAGSIGRSAAVLLDRLTRRISK